MFDLGMTVNTLWACPAATDIDLMGMLQTCPQPGLYPTDLPLEPETLVIVPC